MDEPLRILILTADAGFGHRSAANAIAAALRMMYKDACLIEIANPLDDPRIPLSLSSSQTNHDRWMRENPELYQLGYQASDAEFPSVLVESALGVVLYDVLKDILNSFHPNVVITTYPLYQSAFDAVRTLHRKRLALLTVVTDIAVVHRFWFHSGASLCLVPTDMVREQALASGLRSDQVIVTGLPVHPDFSLQPASSDAIRRELGWRTDCPTILAVGSRRVRGLAQVISGLNHSRLPIQLILVTGNDKELYEQLCQIDWHLPARVYNFVANMPSMMHASDCLISKAGGLIISEALACGLPILLIDANPGQELGNADYVVANGAGRLAETPLDILEILYHWLDLDGKDLAIVANQAKNLGQPKAAFDVAALAWQIAESNAQG